MRVEKRVRLVHKRPAESLRQFASGKRRIYSQGFGDWSEAVFEGLEIERFVVWGS